MTTLATNIKRLAVINDQLATHHPNDTSQYHIFVQNMADKLAATIPGDIHNAAPWGEGYNAVAKWLHRENI